MKVLTYEALSRNFTKMWAAIESNGDEVLIKRGPRSVASIVPAPRELTALDVFSDLQGRSDERH